MRNPRLAISAIVFLSFFLSACSQQKDDADLKQYVQMLEARPAPPITPLPNMQEPKITPMPKGHIRDPFAPQVSAKMLASRPDAGRKPEALEQYPLDSLKMVGTIKVKKKYWALIQTPKGLKRATVGNHMGKKAGKITHITPQKITLSEMIPKGNNKWDKRNIELNLNG
jgi:type IV pilus assembly protein PilP